MKKMIMILVLSPALCFGQLIASRDGGGISGASVSRTGIDTGTGGNRSILRLDTDSVRVLKPQELRRGANAGGGLSGSLTSGSDAILSRFALDLVNVEEVTLKDGTVIKIENIRDGLINSATTLNE